MYESGERCHYTCVKKQNNTIITDSDVYIVCGEGKGEKKNCFPLNISLLRIMGFVNYAIRAFSVDKKETNHGK